MHKMNFEQTEPATRQVGGRSDLRCCWSPLCCAWYGNCCCTFGCNCLPNPAGCYTGRLFLQRTRQSTASMTLSVPGSGTEVGPG